MYRVWAIAANTIAQAVRMKVVGVVIVLLIILLPLMSMIMVGDGTLHGKLQTFISYGLSLASLLLCLLTIAVSTYTLTNDLKRKHIQLVVTKPIRRFQILCGKLLGVVILDVFLLGVFSSIIYVLTLQIPKFTDADQAQIAQAQREFFTARTTLTDPIDEQEIKNRVLKSYDKLKQARQLPADMSKKKILAALRSEELGKATSVEVGAEKIWEFEDVPELGSEERFFIRYKYEASSTPPDGKVHGIWKVGDYRQRELLGPGNWVTPVYTVLRKDPTRTLSEFEVPADARTEDGFLAVVFQNPYINQTTIIPEEVEVLYRAGSFSANYIRAVLMILARLIFLAALGIFVSTWLSFPVAMLICVVIFFTGTINGFVMESFDYLGQGATIIYSLTIKPILWFLPRFDGEFNPTQFMISAKLLSWLFLAKVFGAMVLIKSVLLSLLGIWIFSNREVAKINV